MEYSQGNLWKTGGGESENTNRKFVNSCGKYMICIVKSLIHLHLSLLSC